MIKYLAGIFDAEGYVRIRKTKGNLAKNYSYTPEVKVYMCDKIIIENFAKLYNLKVKTDNRGVDRKLAYHVTFGVKQLKETTFIDDFLPYLNEKRLQLNEVKKILEKESNKEECYNNYMLYKKKFNHPINDLLSFEYLAGIIDGDGWLTMFNGSKGNKAIYNKFAIGLEQRYEPMVRYMLEKFGGNFLQKKIKDRINHTQTYEWKNYNSKEILNILINIEPFLIEKKKVCNRFIDYIKKYEEFREYSEKILKEHKCN